MKCPFKILICICFLFSAYKAKSDNSDTLNFKYVEETTYNYYLEGKWKPLIKIGENAIKANIDYYYLRVRIGYAYYELQNYRNAKYHFEKAVNFNAADTFLLKHLYYSYLYLNENTSSSAILHKFPESMRKKLKIKNPQLISGANIEGGYTFSNNIKENENTDFDDTLNYFGSVNMMDRIGYTQFGITHDLGTFGTLYHGYSGFDIQSKKFEMFNDSLFATDYSINQDDYYFNMNIKPGKGYTIIPAIHFIWNYFSTTNTQPLNPFLTVYTTIPVDTSFLQTSYSLFVTKDYRRVQMGLGVAYSELADIKVTQPTAQLTYYPKGNLDLYSHTVVSYKGVKINPNSPFVQSNSDKVVISELIGAKIFKNTWLEAEYCFGESENYTEKNAYVVYNIPDRIMVRWGLNLQISINPKTVFSIRYTGYKKEYDYFYQQSIIIGDLNKKVLKYTNNSIIGGLTWKF